MVTFVPTPIGNLEDISFRSLNALKDSELILCEDSRVTKKLLNLIDQKLNFSIDYTTKEFLSVHSHNEEKYTTAEYISLYKTKNVVYVSDAGMPCVSDPGAILVDCCIKNNIKYDVIPGANALLVAYAMSGFNQKEFLFYGFLPHKSNNRKAQLEKILKKEYITILYESPKRIVQLLREINQFDSSRELFIVKELTKMHQKFLKGSSFELLEQIKTIDTRGEWVVLINGAKKDLGEAITIDDIQSLELPPKQKSKLIAKLTGKSVKEVYSMEFL